jgi:DNA polymerase
VSLLVEPPPFASFEELQRQALACTKCPLATQGRSQVVFGDGDPHADLVFVGEGPGAEEDKQGIPFVGRAGKLLTQLIEGIGLSFIKPTVLVTLGNFATKLLLETKEGITKLRGREFPFGSGAVLMPTLHPAAVLRGGGTTLAQVRADFVLVKRALQRSSAQDSRP